MTLDDLELTLNGHYAFFYITHMSVGAHHKNFTAVTPILSAAKCTPGMSVYSEISFMRIIAGVRWRGASNDSGVGFFCDFLQICRHISKMVHLRHKVTIGE